VVDINLATFQDTPVQEDFSLLSIGGGVEAEQRMQQGFETNTGIAWGLQTAEEAALRGLQALGRDDKMLTADEANKVYGVEGKLSFNEAMPESVAKLRYNKHINYEARSEILSQAEQDNKGLEWFMQGLAGNVPAIAEAGFGFAVVSGAAPFLIKAAQLAKYGAAGEAIEAALISPFAFGSGATTGIVRGAVGEGAYETLLQVGIKAQADRNGYDYDILWGLASIALGSAGGGLGGFFLGKQADDIASTVKNFETALDDLVESGVITRDGQASIMSKMMSDINSGVITDPKTVNAALRVDYGTALRSKMDNLFESGYLDGIISKAELDKLDDVKLQEAYSEIAFRSYVRQINIKNPITQISQEANGALSKISQQIDELQTQKALNPESAETIDLKLNELFQVKEDIFRQELGKFHEALNKVVQKAKEEGFSFVPGKTGKAAKNTGKDLVTANYQGGIIDDIFKALAEGKKLDNAIFKDNFDAISPSFLKTYTTKKGGLGLDIFIEKEIRERGLDPREVLDELYDAFKKYDRSPLDYWRDKDSVRLSNVIENDLVPREAMASMELDEILQKLDDPNISVTERAKLEASIGGIAEKTQKEGILSSFNSPSEMLFDEFKGVYSQLRDLIKAKKIKNIDNFFTMHEGTQTNIAKLFRLIDPVENNFNFQDLLKLTDDELKAAYTKQLHGRQILNSSSLEEAQGILKGTFKQVDETFNEAVAQLGKETEEMQKVVSSLENKDLDAILKDMNIPEEELAAFKAEIESSAEYQDILKTDSKYQGMAEAARCVLGGL
jgi:hypothetical protein